MSSVLLFNLLFQLFLFNEGGEQCFTFQLIVRIGFCFIKVVSSVYTFLLIVRIVFCFIKVVSSVLLFYLLFQWLLFNEGCEQCFTFQLIVSIVFVKVVCSVLLFNLLCELFFVSLRWWAVFYFSTYCANCFLFH